MASPLAFRGDNFRLALLNNMNTYVIYSEVLKQNAEISTCRRLSLLSHHLIRCLHIFTMATILENNKTIPLNFSSGTILVLKPAPEEKFGPDKAFAVPFDLNLFNKTGDILLDISFSTTRITFKDYALRSLGEGRGKEQTVERNFHRSYGDTVSIHHYLTDSEFGRYQILLNGITVYHFDKRLPGPATQISYKEASHRSPYYYRWGPSYWNVSVYQISDLLPEDRLALVRGR
jgi:hypothetical protein